MRLLYDIAFFGIAIFSLPAFAARLKQADDAGKLLRQRLGILDERLRTAMIGRRVLWIHAVSVGEVMAVENFVRKMLASFPGYHVVLTTVTPTGQKIAEKIAGDHVTVMYYPFDFSFSVRSFLRALAPDCIILAETEIWPNLIEEASRAQIPVGIVNARLSPRSASRYGRFSFLFRPLFEKLEFVLAQTEEDAGRFCKLGTPAASVIVAGNMKYDNVNLQLEAAALAAAWRKKLGIGERERVVVAGSTHPGEEQFLAGAMAALREKGVSARLVIAPRHVERSPKLLQALRKQGAVCVKLSQLPADGTWDILLVDQLGILKELYALADVVFMGGSLVSKGGQNPIEPAALRRAVVHGPHVFNFQKVYQILDQEGGAVPVRDADELIFTLARLLGHPSELAVLGRNAYEAVCSLRGATARTVEWLARFLDPELQLVKG